MIKNGKMVPCSHCNKKIYLQPNQMRIRNFCSRDCHNKYRTIHKPNQHLKTGEIKNCLVCNKKVYVIRARLNRKHYCSKKCCNIGRIKSDEHKRLVNLTRNIRKRAKKKQLNETFTKSDYDIIMKEFKYKCFNCGSRDNLHIDHNKPFAKGNVLSISNAVVLCKQCNSKKHIKDPKDFYSPYKLKILNNKIKGIIKKYSKDI